MSNQDPAPAAAPRLVSLPELHALLADFDCIAAMEQAFRAVSEGSIVAPPGGELLFDDPAGDAHIKFGYRQASEHYIVKIIAGFYDNAKLGLPGLGGLVLVLSRRTGVPVAILLDDGWLTNLRTAAAGAVAARYLAPKSVTAIGVLGTGVQARMQVEQLQKVTPCRDLVVWGRSAFNARQYESDMETRGFHVSIAPSPSAVAERANLIVTVTPAKSPLLTKADIRRGTHITAIGADTAEKTELDPAILAAADIVAVDERELALGRGEVGKAIQARVIGSDRLVELGEIVVDPARGRRSESQITVIDLGGTAAQDILMAEAVMIALTQRDRQA
jgi:ornithine cyclodeaminase